MKFMIKTILIIIYAPIFCYSENIWIPHQTSKSFHYRDVHFVNKDKGWIVGDDGIIINTTDGGDVWNFQDSKTIRAILSVYFINPNLGFACGTGGIVYKTIDGGNNWIHIAVASSDTTFWSIFFINEDTGWTVGHYGTIFKTTDQGNHWIRQISQTNYLLWSVFFINDSTGWIVGDYSVILKTTDSGLNWIKQAYEKSDGLKDVFFVNPDTGWIAGGWNGGIILNTNNGGNSWMNSDPSDFNDLKSLWFIDSMYGWAVGEQGQIIFTSDGGNKWNIQHGNPLDPKLRSICFIKNQFGWTVGEQGLILSTDLKTHVETIQEDETGSIKLPNQTILGQNDPNPFNGSTKIPIQIFEFNHVVLNVYNILGKNVDQLINQHLKPGKYLIHWNPNNLSSGIYFYQIQTKKYRKIKKLIYQK